MNNITFFIVIGINGGWSSDSPTTPHSEKYLKGEKMKKVVLVLLISMFVSVQSAIADTRIMNSSGTTQYRMSSDGSRILNSSGTTQYRISSDGSRITNSNGTTQYRMSSDKTRILNSNGATIYRANKPLTNTQILTIVAGLSR